ncbi:MAG: DUF6288 domain-containing protein [Planctomycetota bacterium]|jgi:hypothetical protein
MPRAQLPTLAFLALTSLAAPRAAAQVHHHPSGAPWNQQAHEGPDAEVQGWLYNLGVTGIRVKLEDEHPTHLLVGHVFDDSPADGKVELGDRIVGAGGTAFETPHRNGYGMEVFGPDGPILDFATALEEALSSEKRKLPLTLQRDDELREVVLTLPRKARAFASTFPADCEHSTEILERLLDHIEEEQRGDGSWGNPIHDTFAPLALLASGERKYRAAVERSVDFHARNTRIEDDSSLVNWKYMAAAIVMSEWYLADGDRRVLRELQEVYDFLCSTQYLDLSQVNPKVRESHPHAWPKNAEQQHGGWGHNPGFEGYGPIAMITAQGALAFALMDRCGIDVDEERHRAAYAFLERGSGSNGYLWYNDSNAGDDKWADMGRTGASAIAHWMSPFEEHSSFARRHALLMAEHPESFPDTHASPLMGMGYGALGASIDPTALDAVLGANRWWFLLAECPDGTFAYQPNRDNVGYGSDARLLATVITAFILTLPEGGLAMTSPAEAPSAAR